MVSHIQHVKPGNYDYMISIYIDIIPPVVAIANMVDFYFMVSDSSGGLRASFQRFVTWIPFVGGEKSSCFDRDYTEQTDCF